MSFMMMLSGRMIDPLNLKPADIDIGDIALGLSTAMRFNGQTKRMFSVAEHSVNVARFMQSVGFPRRTVRQALLHDAPEYILPDLCHTLKVLPQFSFYREMDDAIWRMVAERFDVDVEMHPSIKAVDKRMASNEKLYLQGDAMPDHWVECMRKYPPLAKDEAGIDEYDVKPSLTRRRFLDFFDQVAP